MTIDRKGELNLNKYLQMVLTGSIVAVVALSLTSMGNPSNMGFCIACFLRDAAGALGLHSAAPVQYMRPEIPGIVLGALGAAIFSKEFTVRGGSSPVTRFIIAVCVMIGALVFLGCPLRMVLRIAGGDLNAIVGLFGFASGIGLGVFFLQKGFSLKRAYPQSKLEGLIFPSVTTSLMIALVTVPAIFLFSETGPGSSHAPIMISLCAGLLVGVLGQKSRLCFVAGIRDSVMFKDFSMLVAFGSIIAVVMLGNLILGNFNLGFEGQPIAHTDGIWNFLGLALVGLGSVLLGGCPFRHLVLSGSGNSDSAITVFGLIAGAALAHNFKLASSVEGASANGKPGLLIAILIVVAIAALNTFNRKKEVI